MQTQSTGWRLTGPATSHLADKEANKVELFEIQRLAVKVLNLRPAARFVLEHLIGVYRGTLIGGRMLVWPSNELLMERTGLAERSVRYALRELIETGTIVSKDSANGKRFARKSRQGQIIDAFGFDLSPLLARSEEFEQRYAALKDLERERKHKLDELTVFKRQVRQWLTDYPNASLWASYESLLAATPRRASVGPVDPILARWQAFYSEVEIHYNAACAGNECRHKDHNNDTPDQSCYNGQGVNEGAKPAELELRLQDLLTACRAALAFTGPIRNVPDLVEAASSYRGLIGVSADAWSAACGDIGRVAASTTFLLVLQRKMAPTRGIAPIQNAGGYFRAMTRMVKDGKVNLATEIHKFKQWKN